MDDNLSHSATGPGDLHFELPPESIALHPPENREDSRLLWMRPDGEDEDRRFSELPGLLREGDLLVINDVRVQPVRLYGRKDSGGRVDLLLLGGYGPSQARALLRSNGTLREGEHLQVGDDRVRLDRRLERGEWELELESGSWQDLLDREGNAALPPYIERRRPPGPEDLERYQCVYARDGQAVAAPTAGLHFTATLLDELERRGVRRAPLRLEVGPGTFRPLDEDLPFAEQHLQSERFRVPPETARALHEALDQGRRVVAVGTTVLRSLEAWWRADAPRDGAWADTRIFLHPQDPPRFPLGALITNFHLPRSSLLALVASLAGTERILAAYEGARDRGYRFFSYGDAMLVELH